ncbi:MAG TPA: FecR domain-containing protein [Thermomicrobiales bacterium]|nr:FecR domain-containing protein [Thermomicrobiales bacterium]
MSLADIAAIAELETFGQLPEPPAAGDIILRASSSTTSASRRLYRYGAAALGVAAAAALIVIAARPWIQIGADAVFTVEELVTGTGETNTILLSDGSIVRLGPESRLRITAQGGERQVSLDGRAFFVVASDPDRPFRVNTPGGAVRALGTRFQVDADASEVRVVVLDGRVAVDGIGEHVELGSGQMVRRQGRSLGAVEAAPRLSELSAGWLGHFLVFRDTPLSSAIADIEDMYGVDVVVAGEMSVEPTLTMWLSGRTLEDALTMVCNVIDARCSVEDTEVTIQLR